ncbi:MAG: hypothetical protein PVI91_08090 [Gammaproteobacteria bacterium]|jgi:hypothetical protein
MNRFFKNSAVAATVLATALAGVAGGAWADGGRHGGYGHYKHEHHGHHKHHPVHRKHRHDYRSYGHRKHRGHDDDHENLLIGLVMGGLVGYAIGNHQQTYRYDANTLPPASPQPQEYYSLPQSSYSPGGSTCLQEREYQTKVIVGGKQVDAYGTACLQPDGSWRRGPAELVSY